MPRGRHGAQPGIRADAQQLRCSAPLDFNALIHRDYFTSASIRLLIFADRIEIISPGHLPDSLSTEQIRQGKSNRRNPTLTNHAVNILPYRGIGTGIPRVLQDWPETRLVDDVAGNEFRAVIPRPVTASAEVTPVVTPEVVSHDAGSLEAGKGDAARPRASCRKAARVVLGLPRQRFLRAL